MVKISHLLAKLEKSKIFKDFKSDKENKDTFFCAAFIIINIKQSTFEYSLDFRNNKYIFTFKIPSVDGEEITLAKEELIEGRKPLEKLEENSASKIKADIEYIKDIAEKEMKKNKIGQSLEEIIAVLQASEGKLVWNLTCMAAAFTIINMSINADSSEVIHFEKKNLMDFVSVKKPEKK